MAQKFSNYAASTLASGITSGAGNLSVASAASFPSLGAGDYFYAVLADATDTNHEVVKVTATSGTTFTITRAQDGTTAQAWASGSRIEMRAVAANFNDILAYAQPALGFTPVNKAGDTGLGSMGMQALTLATANVTQLTLLGSGNGSSNQKATFLFDDTGNNSLDIATGYASPSNAIRFKPSGVLALTLAGSGLATFANGINLGQSDLKIYQEGTWTPTVSGLTVVGTPTYTGTYVRIGKKVSFTIRIQSTTSTASSSGTTNFTLPFSPPSTPSTCGAANNASDLGYGVGHIYTDGKIWPPTWPAVPDVVISGFYFL